MRGESLMIAFRLTVFVDFKHRNHELFYVVGARYLLHHCNDLAERWLRSTFRSARPRGPARIDVTNAARSGQAILST